MCRHALSASAVSLGLTRTIVLAIDTPLNKKTVSSVLEESTGNNIMKEGT